MDSIRLSKYFTDCGILSRRAAEEEIKAGKITVNGKPAEIGQKIIPGKDVVEYHGKPVVRTNNAHTYIILNKPRGYVTTMSDDKNRPTVADLTRDAGVRVYPVGRLDMDSDGLLIMTDDGALANKLMHPSHEISKTYTVLIDCRMTTAQLTDISKPHMLDGSMTSPAEIHKIAGDEHKTLISMTIHEGKNRQIRRICEAHDLKVISLTRVSEGSLELGNLPVGKWRRLSPAEVKALRED